MLPKAILDPVSSYTNTELQNVPNAPPNSETALPAHNATKSRLFNKELLFLIAFIV